MQGKDRPPWQCGQILLRIKIIFGPMKSMQCCFPGGTGSQRGTTAGSAAWIWFVQNNNDDDKDQD